MYLIRGVSFDSCYDDATGYCLEAFEIGVPELAVDGPVLFANRNECAREVTRRNDAAKSEWLSAQETSQQFQERVSEWEAPRSALAWTPPRPVRHEDFTGDLALFLSKDRPARTAELVLGPYPFRAYAVVPVEVYEPEPSRPEAF